MNADLEHLIVLQAQDLELARLRGEATEMPRQLAKAEQMAVEADMAMAALRQQLLAEERLRRGQESEINSLRAKLERLRQSMQGASSAAQVTAFEKEIRFAEASIGSLEEEEFASLERTERLEQEESTAGETSQRLSRQAGLEREQGSRVLTENRTQTEGLEQQRELLRAQIPGDILSQYDRLSRSRGSAVAEALGTALQGKCSACQIAVRPQRWRDLTARDHEDTIFSCESCGRMLFWDPRRDTPKAWELGDRLRRAKGGSAL